MPCSVPAHMWSPGFAPVFQCSMGYRGHPTGGRRGCSPAGATRRERGARLIQFGEQLSDWRIPPVALEDHVERLFATPPELLQHDENRIRYRMQMVVEQPPIWEPPAARQVDGADPSQG